MEVERRTSDHRKPSSNPKGGNHPASLFSRRTRAIYRGLRAVARVEEGLKIGACYAAQLVSKLAKDSLLPNLLRRLPTRSKVASPSDRNNSND